MTDLASGQRRARGQSIGAANYKDEDLDALMDVAKVVIPVGKRGWNMVAVDFAEWVRKLDTRTLSRLVGEEIQASRAHGKADWAS